MPRPLLFCNVGWMKRYQGQTKDDKIIGGGQYVKVKKRGHEVCNFLPIAGRAFGYVQPVGDRIVLTKLGAPRDSESLDGVDVVVTARRPGGDTVIVGWFENATVYEWPQPLRRPSARHKSNRVNSYRYKASAKDVKLLAPEQRTFIVPRGKHGIGQSNVWYAHAAAKSWLTQVRGLMRAAARPQLRRGVIPKRGKPDPFNNAKVESAAMGHVWSHYQSQGYRLHDVSKENRGWDLEAKSGSLTLRIEVKGLSSDATSIELTPREYTAFGENSHTYRLCIVTMALVKPYLIVCSFNLASNAWAVETLGKYNSVRVKERVGATITVA